MTIKKTLAEIHKEAIIHNCLCISYKYVDRMTKLDWVCIKGHQWQH